MTRVLARPTQQDQLDRRVLELTTLYEVSKILGASLDLEHNLTGILRVLNSFMGMRKGTIPCTTPCTTNYPSEWRSA